MTRLLLNPDRLMSFHTEIGSDVMKARIFSQEVVISDLKCEISLQAGSNRKARKRGLPHVREVIVTAGCVKLAGFDLGESDEVNCPQRVAVRHVSSKSHFRRLRLVVRRVLSTPD
jgi:hypothetical protein